MSGNWYASYPVKGGVVSLNGQTGAISLVAGSNITITPGSGTLTISATGSGANTALSNLASTAVNASIIPGVTGTIDLGSDTLRWRDGYFQDTINIGTSGVHGIYGANSYFAPAASVYSFFVNQLRIFGLTGPGKIELANTAQTFYVGFRSPAALAATTNWELPAADGTSGQVLSTNGATVLSWVTASGGGANTALSNLAATNINADLIPDTDIARSIGSAGFTWANGYFGSLRRHTTGTVAINTTTSELLDTSGSISIGFNSRIILNPSSSIIFDYSGTHPSLNTHKLTDVVDPTNPQDAATKAYVDATTGSTYTVELRTITGGEAAAEQLTLGATPTIANFTILAPQGAPSQFYGDDFTVTGNVLSWAGLGLSGILTTGDKLTISYN